jgi:outer membrane receptor protein involved in Fe transport
VLRQLIDQDPATGERLEQPVGVNVNAGDATVLGGEISAAFNVTEFLTATATLGWADAELDNARQDTYALVPHLPRRLRHAAGNCRRAQDVVRGLQQPLR